MKSLLLLALLIPAADVPAPAPDPAAIRAVMFEFTYVEKTMTINHAQAIGGFATVDACRSAMPRVYGEGASQLDEGEAMQLECSGIRERAPDAPEVEAPTKPGVAL